MDRRSLIPALSVLIVGLVFGQGPSTLTVSGDIPAPLTLKAEDLAAMPREKATVPDQDGTEIEYEGVPLREILKKAGAPLGGQLRGNEQIIVADKRDGKSLFGYQGPFRLVCPKDKAGARSVRMLETLEFVRLQK